MRLPFCRSICRCACIDKSAPGSCTNKDGGPYTEMIKLASSNMVCISSVSMTHEGRGGAGLKILETKVSCEPPGTTC